MRRHRSARSILARAAFGAINGTGIYYAKAKQAKEADTDDDDAGGGAADDSGAPAKLELTEQELQDRIEAATAAAIKADRAERKKEQQRKKREQAREEEEEAEEEQEDPQDILREAEAEKAKAQQERDEARRELLVAKVENKLRSYLMGNFKEFVGNTEDILLHIERHLSADAKDAEIARLIESHAKAFVERTKAARPAANPMNIARGRITGAPPVTQTETRTASNNPEPQKRFAALNWHG